MFAGRRANGRGGHRPLLPPPRPQPFHGRPKFTLTFSGPDVVEEMTSLPPHRTALIWSVAKLLHKKAFIMAGINTAEEERSPGDNLGQRIQVSSGLPTHASCAFLFGYFHVQIRRVWTRMGNGTNQTIWCKNFGVVASTNLNWNKDGVYCLWNAEITLHLTCVDSKRK